MYDSLVGPGLAAGNSITDSAYQIVVDIYSGRYGILDWLSKTCLFFATPIAAVGFMQKIDDKDTPYPMPKGMFYGVLALVVCLSRGGFVMGHLYLFMYQILEAFAKGMDSRMSVYNAIESGKGFLSSNALLSANFAECHKLVGIRRHDYWRVTTAINTATLINRWLSRQPLIDRKIYIWQRLHLYC